MRYEPKDRVVFITGASSGIGRACANEFHRAGSRVVAVARSTEKLRSLEVELGGARLLTAVADVTDVSQRDAALSLARNRFGSIDVLVNNAGWASYGSVRRMPPGDVESMLALNFSAPVALIQAVLPEMLGRGSGQIINISSVVGYQPMPRMAVYCATKAALNALTTSLRLELRGTGVDVILVAPGSTRTGFFESARQIDTKAVRQSEKQQSPEQVARAVLRSSRSRRKEVILTPQGKLICMLRRISSRLADQILFQVSKKSMPELAPN